MKFFSEMTDTKFFRLWHIWVVYPWPVQIVIFATSIWGINPGHCEHLVLNSRKPCVKKNTPTKRPIWGCSNSEKLGEAKPKQSMGLMAYIPAWKPIKHKPFMWIYLSHGCFAKCLQVKHANDRSKAFHDPCHHQVLRHETTPGEPSLKRNTQ